MRLGKREREFSEIQSSVYSSVRTDSHSDYSADPWVVQLFNCTTVGKPTDPVTILTLNAL